MPEETNNFQDLLSKALKVKNRRVEEPEITSETTTTERQASPQKRTCENCTCIKSKGGEKPKITREELKAMTKEEINKLANGGCQGCKMGDAFRCAQCPFLGLKSFEDGETVFFDDL
ncbi:Protein DRE2 [Pseudoloma neurophilia]|uniref:Protein DRE2 n=1 Tax=Pseudoloma neurophilia TaxID=146866 RepID=A0A0R0M3V1_9MICR|nr:Protein DRE2 [Pseudoloma neurophilia]